MSCDWWRREHRGQCVWPDLEGSDVKASCSAGTIKIRITLRWVNIHSCFPLLQPPPHTHKHESQRHRGVHVQCSKCSSVGWFGSSLYYMSPQHRTLSECVDGVTGWQVGAGDKVFTRGRLHLHSRPALQVAVETAHLPGWEGDVGHAAFIAVPWRTVKEKRWYTPQAQVQRTRLDTLVQPLAYTFAFF